MKNQSALNHSLFPPIDKGIYVPQSSHHLKPDTQTVFSPYLGKHCKHYKLSTI